MPAKNGFNEEMYNNEEKKNTSISNMKSDLCAHPFVYNLNETIFMHKQFLLSDYSVIQRNGLSYIFFALRSFVCYCWNDRLEI